MAHKNLTVSAQNTRENPSLDVAQGLCEPLDEQNLSFNLCMELYHSKLVYLNHLHKQCFKVLNSQTSAAAQVSGTDLANLQRIILMTQLFMGHIEAPNPEQENETPS